MYKSEKVWDRFAKNFDNYAKQFDEAHIKTVENTKKYLKVKDIVLDYGCATGTFAIEFSECVNEIHGIDISSEMIDAANRKKNEHKIENIDFTQSTIFDERFKKESFDVILAFNILHLLENTGKTMQRISKLLKHGGSFISAAPCMGEKRSLFNILIFLLTKIIGIPYIRFFKISELEKLIINENFQIIEIESLAHKTDEYFIVAKKK